MSDTLKSRIIRHIAMSGPIPLAEYMHWCMADRSQGYYKTQNAIGSEGDFVTAPEISQMFGELIGIWAIQAWQSIGAPKRFSLVELGPGHGTLMADLLRATSMSKEFQQAAHTVLIETSDQLINIQREKLHGHDNISWASEFDEVSSDPVILIANEFLDVLPFRQYVKANGQWHENSIGLDDDAETLKWVLGTGLLSLDDLPAGHLEEPDGAVFEVSQARELFVRRIADVISTNDGAALFIDYGHAQSGFGDTFQALKSHAFADPLAEPGSADLTSHVDFGALVSAISDCSIHCNDVLTQGEFLLSLGLLERAGQLGAGKSETVQAELTGQAERLALPTQMGELFKVLSFSSGESLSPIANRA
ncbi:MAG: class I SAM-dependent methyltransferase [Pseudomonadota bacterium]